MHEPIFMLSPPRSFSSVCSTIIGQHPQLYTVPELQIFGSSDVGSVLEKNFTHLGLLAPYGLLRILAELHEGVQTDGSCSRAWQWLMERREMSVTDLFDYIRKRLYPFAVLEKTPANASSVDKLDKILSAYPSARFIHLTRSVNGNYSSLLEYLNFLVRHEVPYVLEAPRVNGRSLELFHPALLWYSWHRNIIDLLEAVPVNQFLRIKGEDLLNDPRRILPQLCDWLGVDRSDHAIDAMLRPHESPFAYVGPRIAPGGNDWKFMQAPVFRAKPQQAGYTSFRDPPLPDILHIDIVAFFESMGHPLSASDRARVEAWGDQLSEEIEAMQVRLGYS